MRQPKKQEAAKSAVLLSRSRSFFRLRARVAELEADLSGTRAALADRTAELRDERGEATGGGASK